MNAPRLHTQYKKNIVIGWIDKSPWMKNLYTNNLNKEMLLLNLDNTTIRFSDVL